MEGMAKRTGVAGHSKVFVSFLKSWGKFFKSVV